MKNEKEKFTSMLIKDFAKKVISDGHLYLSSSGGGKKFYVMRPGILVDPTFIKKYARSQTVFSYQQVINPTDCDSFRELFKQLKYLHFEKDLRLQCQSILQKFKNVYENEGHLLTFSMACYYEFNQVPYENLLKMHEADLYLFQKSMYSASLAVLIALSNDYHDFKMIRDFYNITFSLDIGLSESYYTFFVAEACNRENREPGSGKTWLQEQKASDEEIKLFLDHPKKAHDFLKHNKGILSFSELAEISLYQHELSNGSGFPRGVNKSHISSWEAITILADSMVEIGDRHIFEEDPIGFIAKFKNAKLTQLPVLKVFLKVCHSLGINSDFKEAAG